MKRIVRSAAALVLALIMCLSLAACGSSAGNTGSSAPAATPAPEYVYVSEYTDLITNSKDYPVPRVFCDEGYYSTSWEKIGEQEIPEGVTPEYEGQYDIYASLLYLIDNDGNIKKLENYVPMENDSDGEGRQDFSTSCNLSGMALDSQGHIITAEEIYSSWYDGPEGVSRYSDDYWMYQKYENRWFIRCLEKDGTEISRAEIRVGENEYPQLYNMNLDSSDNVIFASDFSIRAVNLAGEDVFNIPLTSYVDGMFKLQDGRIATALYDDIAQKPVVCIVDSEKGELGERFEFEESINAYNAIPGMGEYDFLFTSGTNFYGVILKDSKVEKLFNWVNCDVNGDTISSIAAQKDGTIDAYAINYDQHGETYGVQRITVKKVPGDSVPRKDTIRMAVMYLDYQVLNRIVEFNRSNDRYRIEVEDYSEYNRNSETNDEGLTKLQTEIMAGNIPDILAMGNLNYTQLASKGLLEDLYPYIDADPEISREDFFPNLLKAMEVDGKLCVTIPSFYISTVIGSSKIVGDEPGWTYDELNEALSRMPEGCTVFDKTTTKSDILQECLALDMNDFVDWGTGRCSFDSEEFIGLLEFVNGFPDEFDWDNYEWSEEDSLENRLEQGKQMLVKSYMYSVEDTFYNNYEQVLGGKITYIGYPTLNGTGNFIGVSDAQFAMSSKSAYKDVIWEFLRSFFMEKYQNDSWSLPSNRNVFMKKLEQACTIEYMKDDDGNIRLDENGEKVPVIKYVIWDKETGKEIPYYGMSEEQADQLLQLVEGTTKVADYNSSIFDIVQEQAAAYFAGQKSAQDVAKLVQSKANIFVNEQR